MKKTETENTAFLQTFWEDKSYKLAFLERPAVKENTEKTPLIIWFTGFRSTMRGIKAERIDQWAAKHGLGCIRFDYSGHGESDGEFEECTLSRWLADAMHIIEFFNQKHILLAGSSMGGWLALLCALRLKKNRPDIRISGLLLLAPAINLTEELIWNQLPDIYQTQLMEEGKIMLPYPDADNPVPITRALIEDGRQYLLYREFTELGIPVHILQGKQDKTVPWKTAQTLFENLPQDPVSLTFIHDAAHGLERAGDLEMIERILEGMLQKS